jgi:hypothetical protein
MKAQAGAIAQQQALVLVFGLSYRQAAKVAGVNHRNLWSHVAAKHGSKVASWESRSIEIQNAAIEKVINNVVTEADASAECRFLYQFDGSNFVEIYADSDNRKAIENALSSLNVERVKVGNGNPLLFELPPTERV